MVKKVLVMMIALAVVLAFATPVTAAKPLSPKVLEAVFIHYEHPGKPQKPPGTETPKVYDYYKLLGPKWDLSQYTSGVPYVINPSGGPTGAVAEVIASLEAWDAATGAELFDDNPLIDTNSWWGQEDGKNNISWQVFPDGRVIAGVWVWFYDIDGNGGMSPGDIVKETDMVFNASQRWGIDQDGEGTAYKLRNTYDVRNIATHEAGHIVGLDDIYETIYSEITMYGYGAKGETKKISLATGDVNGTLALYPNPIAP